MNRILSLFVPKEGKRLRTNRYMLYSSMIVIGVLFGMIAYLGKFIAYDSQTQIASGYNKRTKNLAERVIRGDIYSANGETLACNEHDDEGNEIRRYPYGDLFAHVVGYNSSSHGKTGIESICNYLLLSSSTDIKQQFENAWNKEKNQGDSVVTTLDTRLQQAAYDALDDYRGAIILMEPASGKVLALVSKPDFNPNVLDDNWEEMNEDETNSCLVNRATQGLYPPGSTYKIITTLEYMRENPDTYQKFSYDCDGETIVQSVHINCYEGEEHGKIGLHDAFAQSCNTAFVTMGSQLSIPSFVELNENLLFNQSISSDLKIRQSEFKLKKNSEESQMPQTVIGQGETLMTPMHNALVMCAIANDGILMRPYVIDHYITAGGREFNPTKTKELDGLMTQKEARKLRKLLRAVVEEGTGHALKTDRFIAGGKTGTAENSGENSHSWFVGFAGKKKNKADVVVCVIVENTGAGSRYAAPMARQVIDAYYDIIENE